MKFLVCFVAVFAIVKCGKLPEKYEKTVEECIKESGVDRKVHDDAYKNGNFAEDPKLKTYTLCFMTKSGFQDEHGALQTSVIQKGFQEKLGSVQEADKLVKICIGEGVGAEKLKKEERKPEIVAYETMKCFRKNFPKDKLKIVEVETKKDEDKIKH